MCSSLTWSRSGGLVALLLLIDDENLDSPLCLLRPHLKKEREEYIVTTRWRWKSRLPTWFLLLQSWEVGEIKVSPGRDESSGSSLGLLWHYLSRCVEMPRYSLARVKV